MKEKYTLITDYVIPIGTRVASIVELKTINKINYVGTYIGDDSVERDDGEKGSGRNNTWKIAFMNPYWSPQDSTKGKLYYYKINNWKQELTG